MEEEIQVVENEEPPLTNNWKRSKLWEMGSVLLLIAAPTISSWGCYLFWDGDYQIYRKIHEIDQYRSSLAYNVASFNDFVLHLRYLPIVFYIIWRSGEGWAYFGLAKPQWHKDIFLGIGLAFVIIFVNGTFHSLVGNSHISSLRWDRFYPGPLPVNLAILLLGRCCAVAFAEELVGRAYLIPRLEEMTKSSWQAIIISSILFGLLHSHQGALSVFLKLLWGLLWGATFCKTRRIWPLVISHAMIDYIVFTHLKMFVGM